MKPILLTAALAFTLALAAVAGISLNLSGAPVQAQDATLPAPANVQAADGANPGEVAVSWDAVANASFYRIGWVAYDDIDAARADGREWLDAFAFSDVANRGQTSHTLKRLTPCLRYAFIAASLNRRFGDPSWSQWALLTPGDSTASCPAVATTPTPTPTPTPTLVPPPTTAATPTPAGTDYDDDHDGLIEVSNLAQLAAIRADLNGDGISPIPAAYSIAFPNAMPGMGCPETGCIGYELAADLDFDTNGNDAPDAADAYWNNGAGWIPIGHGANTRFTADFDGNNHTIANLYINRSGASYTGLFGHISGGTIKRVGLVSATVSGNIAVGGLVGHSSRRSTISGSYATGSVSGDRDVGGLVGSIFDSVITASYATVAISGNAHVGGLVGEERRTTVTASYATGSVSGKYDVGGLVGHNSQGGTITTSYATGSVSGDGRVGGLVGFSSYGPITTSYATGSVSGGDDVGGLVGFSASGPITASYATGNVSGDDYIGGLVGRDSSTTITASYAVGRVSTSGNTSNIGGLVGSGGRGIITASYWDTETTGQAGSYGGIGKTTAELQSPTDYAGIYAGWNLDLDGDRAADNPWHFGNSRQYPALQYASLDPAAQRP